MNIIDPEKIRLRARLLAALNEAEPLARAIDLMSAALAAGGKVLAFGNGGSATQSSHFAAELVNKFYFRRRALPALALSADMANVTSIANDEEFRVVFSRQVEAFAVRGDVALGLLRAIPTDIVIAVDADDTPAIQEMHLFVLHVMAEMIEKNLCGGNHDHSV
jgi:D-sedoheptulose 7-phosphate isomerase